MNDDAEYDPQRFLQEARDGLKESVAFFRAGNNAEQEVWTATAFLRNLGLAFDEGEVCASKVEPVDVVFRDAKFQVKEIMDKGRPRHDEYKVRLRRAEQAEDPEQLVELYTPSDITPTEIVELVHQRIAVLNRKYAPQDRRALDGLFYVNFRHRHYANGEWPDLQMFQNCGWRSVSVLCGWQAMVLFRAPDAPAFLQVGNFTKTWD